MSPLDTRASGLLGLVNKHVMLTRMDEEATYTGKIKRITRFHVVFIPDDTKKEIYLNEADIKMVVED